MPHLFSLPPEIFEAVLLELPEDTLFGVQQVHSAFRDAIKSCTALRRKLWIDEPSANEVQLVTNDTPIGINPILCDIKCLSIKFPPDEYDCEGYKTDKYFLRLSILPSDGNHPVTLMVNLIHKDSNPRSYDYEKRRILRKQQRFARLLLSSGSQKEMQLVSPALPIQMTVEAHKEQYILHLPAKTTVQTMMQCLRQAEEDLQCKAFIHWEWMRMEIEHYLAPESSPPVNDYSRRYGRR